MLYDVFICHASEDKEDFVLPLANELRKSHLEVWYDDFTLTVGDSLRESIDKGLAKSRFGVVVLSPSFFRKKWPSRELNGLVAREMTEPRDLILPIWHHVSQADVVKYSPPLADRRAVNSKLGIKAVCTELLRKLRPQGSPLIVARDELLNFGLNPPVVTDEWWLDVIEASNRIPDWGMIPPENSTWGRWTFPLPESTADPTDRGLRLAWTAMQMTWEKAAGEQPITQITRPEVVHDFIASQPGLGEACHRFPRVLANYAPQLTIRGLSGPFDHEFDQLLASSVRRSARSTSGSGLTSTGSPPLCDEEIALRHPSFGDYEPDSIACHFVQGELWGPSPKFYEIFDYLIWFMSSDSSWLPATVHAFLLDGMRQWNQWLGSKTDESDPQIKEFQMALLKSPSFKSFKLTRRLRSGLESWVEASLHAMRLTDHPSSIVDNFLDDGFIESFFAERQRRSKR